MSFKWNLFALIPLLLLVLPKIVQLLPIFAPLISFNLSVTTNQNQANQNHSIIYYHNRRSVRSVLNSSEYDNFLSSLEAMDAIRKEKFLRLNNHYKHQNLRPNLNLVLDPPVRPSLKRPGQSQILVNINSTAAAGADGGLDQFQYRKFNFSTEIEFGEEEFDCDLNLLSKCESSLLTKIELIEDRHEVFTTLNDRVASQKDILEICRSIDVEFKCLYDYAQKCEHQMSYSTFTILRYIITTNNETIVSCRHKEMDWLDINSHDRIKEQNKVIHPFGSCISKHHVYECLVDSFGPNLDTNLVVVKNDTQCEAAQSYEKCLKHWLFEGLPNDSTRPSCQLEQKEKSLKLLLSMIRFNISDSVDSLYCKKLASYWNIKYSNKMEPAGSDVESGLSTVMIDQDISVQDRATKLTNLLRNSYIALLPNQCTASMDNVQELCFTRYQHRLGKLWNELEINFSKVKMNETDMMCCVTSELTDCLSNFVLVCCGRQQFVTFRQQSSELSTDQSSSSLPVQCHQLDHKSSHCQSLLKS